MCDHEYELCHHGVKGMKWGVRKKSPRSYVSDNPKRKSSNVANSKVDRIKKAVKIGAAASAVVLATYGGYKVSNFLNSCSYTVNGKSVSKKEFMSAMSTVAKSLR